MFKKIIILNFIFIIISIMINADNKQIIKSITSREGYELIQKNKNNINFVILDVRSPDEFKDGHIENAINIDLNSKDYFKQIKKLNKNKTYLVYCQNGNRQSGTVVKDMYRLNFMEVYDMGDIAQWKEACYKLVKK